jgi:hypothetical protein
MRRIGLMTLLSNPQNRDETGRPEVPRLLIADNVEQRVGPTDGAVQDAAALGPNGIDRPAYLGTEL